MAQATQCHWLMDTAGLHSIIGCLATSVPGCTALLVAKVQVRYWLLLCTKTTNDAEWPRGEYAQVWIPQSYVHEHPCFYSVLPEQRVIHCI